MRAVFTLVTFIFIACVFSTLYSFKEIPLEVLQKSSKAELQRVSDTSSSSRELDTAGLMVGRMGVGCVGRVGR